MKQIAPLWKDSKKAHLTTRRACYFSAEFLVGRAIYNNLLCLGIEDEANDVISDLGAKLSDLEEIEDADILQIIKEYALALCKIIEGNIRRKLQSAPGAISMDGDALVSEGTAEKSRLDEYIPKQFSYLRFGVRC